MIDTERGQFSDLAELRWAFMEDSQGRPKVEKYFRAENWEPDLFHISELGKCPRKQILRMLGTKPKPRSKSVVANEALMFWQGNMIHALTAGALEWAGILVSYEQALELPHGWTGHYDVVYVKGRDVVLWDGKTVRPNAFDYWYEWPKPEVVWQLNGYLAFPSTHHANYGEVEYIDRGGANSPQVFRVDLTLPVVSTMERLDFQRLDAFENNVLPEPLEPRFKATYRKLNNLPAHRINKVWLTNSWECEWCDYLYSRQDKKTKLWSPIPEHAPCHPEMCRIEVASTIKGELKVEPPYLQAVNEWLGSQIAEWVDVEVEEETEGWPQEVAIG